MNISLTVIDTVMKTVGKKDFFLTTLDADKQLSERITRCHNQLRNIHLKMGDIDMAIIKHGDASSKEKLDEVKGLKIKTGRLVKEFSRVRDVLSANLKDQKVIRELLENLCAKVEKGENTMLISLKTINLVLKTASVSGEDLHTLAKEAEKFFSKMMERYLFSQTEACHEIREHGEEIKDLEMVIERSAHEFIQTNTDIEQARIGQLKRWIFDSEKQFNRLNLNFQMVEVNRENVLNLLDKLEGPKGDPRAVGKFICQNGERR